MTPTPQDPVCQQIPELLPWMLNGTLSEDEEQFVQAHLAECESCCRELQETVEVWQLATTHIPSLALAEYAQGLDPQGIDRQTIEEHLAVCPSCSQELEMALPGLEPTGVIDFAAEREKREAAKAQPWRNFAVAASLTAVLATGTLMWSLTGLSSSSVQSLETMASRPAIQAPQDPSESEASSGLLFADGFEDMSGWTRVVGLKEEPKPARN